MIATQGYGAEQLIATGGYSSRAIGFLCTYIARIRKYMFDALQR